ncbi:hypothetical protein BDBG_09461 [Blastomyces gilchristii SLH14081]|uniref:Uncharacterized protein n=1 Tax=Blastomyces gilchristii (strain SLH14081) TaxID=559298 RepID=A0A179V2V7_BLAGS|nr:uncharacterized protein BDBG_09461 [Blastomyces gilchristii SLH14081]OAT14420.1 hypothetical protein BDBG_09461 [Blastomyces gilchristii SLH14081]
MFRSLSHPQRNHSISRTTPVLDLAILSALPSEILRYPASAIVLLKLWFAWVIIRHCIVVLYSSHPSYRSAGLSTWEANISSSFPEPCLLQASTPVPPDDPLNTSGPGDKSPLKPFSSPAFPPYEIVDHQPGIDISTTATRVALTRPFVESSFLFFLSTLFRPP